MLLENATKNAENAAFLFAFFVFSSGCCAASGSGRKPPCDSRLQNGQRQRSRTVCVCKAVGQYRSLARPGTELPSVEPAAIMRKGAERVALPPQDIICQILFSRNFRIEVCGAIHQFENGGILNGVVVFIKRNITSYARERNAFNLVDNSL